MKLISILFVLTSFAATSACVGQASSAWSDSLYEQFDFKSFAEYAPALQRIDMDSVDYALLDAAIFYETNRQRSQNSVPLLTHSPFLERAAVIHSNDMVEYKFFDHTSRLDGHENLKARLMLVGIQNVSAAENIATSFGIEYKSGEPVYTPDQNGGYFSYTPKGEPILNHTYLGFARATLEQLMSSGAHRHNILDSRYHFFGAGAAHFKDSGFYDIDTFKVTQVLSATLGDGE